MTGSNEELRARRAQKLKSLRVALRVALGNASLLTGEEIAAFDYAIAALAEEGWVNCGKCRSPGSCGLTENCFGGHKDNG